MKAMLWLLIAAVAMVRVAAIFGNPIPIIEYTVDEISAEQTAANGKPK